MAKKLHVISIGKTKETPISALENEYLARVHQFSISIHNIKAHGDNLKKEGEEVVALLSKLYPTSKNSGPANFCLILLSENGESLDSVTFSKKLFELAQNQASLCFILGGAMGHAPAVLALSSLSISLSPLTFPHKLARLLLIEQIYRAETLYNGHPYHH
jgi:23S rRNA (pseudouridine1915-N3)-methyltransferase